MTQKSDSKSAHKRFETSIERPNSLSSTSVPNEIIMTKVIRVCHRAGRPSPLSPNSSANSEPIV